MDGGRGPGAAWQMVRDVTGLSTAGPGPASKPQQLT